MLRRIMPDTFTVLLVAVVIVASIVPARGEFADWFGVATNVAIGALFFLHGARLSTDVVVAGMLHWRLHLVILAVTFIAFPLLGLAVGLIPAWILPEPLFLGILYLCVLPSTVQSSIAFTSIAGGNVPAAICAATTSNILGMVLTPLLVSVLLSFGGLDGVSWDAVEKIMLQLLAPFVAGQVLQPWIGRWIRSKKSILMPFDRTSILMVVYLAFSKAVSEGIWNSFSLSAIVAVVVIDIAILAAVMLLTVYGSRRLGFNKPDHIAIVFCGSKKSLASGIPMASIIFGGQAIGAIVLPLMLFHQIQLIVCAVVAARYARGQVADSQSRTRRATA